MPFDRARARIALLVLTRDRLGELADMIGKVAKDGRSRESWADAILEDETQLGEVLGRCRRAELKSMCEVHGVDASGKELAPIIARLVSSLGGSVKPLELSAEPITDGRTAQSKARISPPPAGEAIGAYRHDATRKNNPPAGLIDHDRPPLHRAKSYSYDPHLDPQLSWSGKAEQASFDVDTVSLHIHEAISPQAILRVAKREDAQRSLFAEPALDDSKQIEFYTHDVGWRNRLVLGDSLLVMNSLLEREQMAGRVQCIYLDPPYGVKFNSNFQPSISRRDVKDGDDASLTREPEQIQAYRDTWTLGIHSYLSYLRDRLLLSRELLGESGSIFVQISDENLHHVRELMGEIFGEENFCGVICFRKTSSANSPTAKVNVLASVADYVVWYARDFSKVKYRPLFAPKTLEDDEGNRYTRLELRDGTRRPFTSIERENPSTIPKGARIFRHDNLTSQTAGETTIFEFEWNQMKFRPGKGGWKTNLEGMKRLARANRLGAPTENSLAYVRFLDDFPATPLANVWTDTQTGAFTEEKRYVVQTNTKVVTRCILMTTDPGDLVLDPTCGSGTSAMVAEQWGRRWITCDTSRVALSIARQRLLTSRYPYFRLRSSRVRDGFQYKSVPHVTLKSIAQNPRLDACKTHEERERLIRETADQEVLYDQPEEDKKRVRVTGPFTVEAIPEAAMLDESSAANHQTPDGSSIAKEGTANYRVADGAGEYVGRMLDLLRKTGVHFPKGKTMNLDGQRPVSGPHDWLHAEATTGTNGKTKRVAISFGPQHAPVTPMQVRDAITETRGYDALLFVGFALDPEAGKMIDKGIVGCEMHFAHAAPDILIGDLLKSSKTTKLFTVFGSPDVRIAKEKDGHVTVELTGVDLYDPNTGDTEHDDGENVAAWFLDQDYDQRCFCVCQAFFPGRKTKNPWEKLQKALKGTIDEEKFEALRGTKSLPFKAGKKIAVKVIDDRGNEIVKVVDAR